MVYNITHPSTHYTVIPSLTFQQGHKIIHDKTSEYQIMCAFINFIRLLYNVHFYKIQIFTTDW
jgi:hypothetical protein